MDISGTGVVLGAAYGAAGVWYGHYDWGIIFLAGTITAVGALTPDLDSDSGLPIRELFGLAGAVFPLFLFPRLRHSGLEHGTIAVRHDRRLSVHSLWRFACLEKALGPSRHVSQHPALFIAGLAVFDVYHNDNAAIRLYMAGGMMLGFLSHLFLDELFAVDLRGIPRLKNSFGTAIKLTSQSWKATVFCYLLLFLLVGFAIRENKTNPYHAAVTPITRTEVSKLW